MRSPAHSERVGASVVLWSRYSNGRLFIPFTRVARYTVARPARSHCARVNWPRATPSGLLAEWMLK